MQTHVPLQASNPIRDNTAAVVVLFHPEGDLTSRLSAVQSQVDRLFVVSNDDDKSGRLNGLELERLESIQNNGNVGLASALNIGIANARQQGYVWCMLLDQDTVVDDGLLVGLAETYAAYPGKDTVGLLVPNYRSPGGVRFAYRTDAVWQRLATAVTAGSLVPLAVIDRVGGMREAFFIEGIDLEFSLRLRSIGLQIVASGRPLMTHGGGAAEERNFFGRTVLVGNHPPWRCYLQYRNLTWILLHYFWTEPKWTAVTLLAMLKRFILVSVFERQRAAKLWAMLRGMGVGVRQVFSGEEKPANYRG